MTINPDIYEEEEPSLLDTFDSVAEAIIENTPDFDTGVDALRDAYDSYAVSAENKAPFEDILRSRTSQVYQKFDERRRFDYEGTLEVAPIDLADVEGEGGDEQSATIDKINKWEVKNLEFLENSDDTFYIQNKDFFSDSIRKAAVAQRRGIYGSDNYWVTDWLLRAGQGAVGGVASLVGLDEVDDWFTERTNKDWNDSWGSAISSGVGSVGGALAAGAAAALTAPVSIPAATAGAVGSAAYLAAAGAGAVKKQYDEAVMSEGTTEEALTAAGIEAASQAGQALVGGKVFGSVAGKILGKAAPKLGAKVYPQAVTIGASALSEGVAEGTGQVLSNVATNIGQGKDEDLTEGVFTSFTVGALLGGGATAVGEYAASRRMPAVADFDPSNNSTLVDADIPVVEPVTPITEQPAILQEQQELENAFEDTEGSPPPPFEPQREKSIAYPITPANSEVAAVREDGSKVLRKDGDLLIEVGNDSAAEAYTQTYTISPEIKAKLDELGIKGVNEDTSHSPDGMVLPLVTVKGELYIDSPFVSDDLTLLSDKRSDGKKRVKVPASVGIAPGGFTVGADTIRTKGVKGQKAVRAPRYTVSNSPTQTVNPNASTVGAAKAGYGQVEGKFAKRLTRTYGPEISERMGRIATGTEQNADGTTTETITPLDTYFRQSTKFVADEAATYIEGKGAFETLSELESKVTDDSDVFSSVSEADAVMAQMLEQGFTEAANDAMAAGDYIQADMLYKTAGSAATVARQIGTKGGRVVNLYSNKARNAAGMQSLEGAAQVNAINSALITSALTDTAKELELPSIDPKVLQAEAETAAAEAAAVEVDLLAEEDVAEATAEKELGIDIEDDAPATEAPKETSTEGTGTKEAKRPSMPRDKNNRKYILTPETKQELKQSKKDLANARRKLTNEQKKKRAKPETLQALQDELAKTEEAHNNLLNKVKEEDLAERARARAEAGVGTRKRLTDAQNAARAKKAALTKAQNKIQEYLSKFPPEEQQQVRDLYKLLETTTGIQRLKVEETLYDIETKYLPNRPATRDILLNRFYASTLSGLSTVLNNMTSVVNTGWAGVSFAAMDAINIARGKQSGLTVVDYAEGVLRGFFGRGRREAMRVLRGEIAGRSSLYADATNIQTIELPDGQRDAVARDKPNTVAPLVGPIAPEIAEVGGVSIKIPIGPLLTIERAVGRTIAAWDTLMYNTNVEAVSRKLAADKVRRDPSIPRSERRQAIENIVYGDQKALEASVANDIAALKSAGIEISERDAKIMLFEATELARDEQMRDAAVAFGVRQNMMAPPDGRTMFGAIAKGINTAASSWEFPLADGKIVRPLKVIIPFTTFASNMVNRMIEYVPGLNAIDLLASSLQDKSKGNVDARALEMHERLGNAIVGAGLMATATAIFSMYADEEDPFISWTGAPPDKINYYLQNNIPQNALKIGNSYYSKEVLGPVALLFALSSSAANAIKKGGDPAEIAGITILSAGATITDMSVLKNLSSIMEAVSGGTDADSTGSRAANALMGVVTNTATPLVIPATGFLKNLYRWYDGAPRETYNNLMGKFSNQIPILTEATSGVRLNDFGEPIEGTDWWLRPVTGLYRQRLEDPVRSWMTETGYKITAPSFSIPLSKKDSQIYANLRPEGFEDKLTKEESIEVLKISGPQIKALLSQFTQLRNYNQNVQDRINTEVARIRGRAKAIVLNQGGY